MMRWNYITRWLEELDAERFIEVGVYRGSNMRRILRDRPLLMAEGVDDWRPQYMMTPEVQREARRQAFTVQAEFPGRLKLIEGASVDVARARTGPQADVVFIDASHDEDSVWEDLVAWVRHVRPGGYISGHDYLSKRHPGVRRAVDEFFAGDVNSGPEDKGGGVWWVQM